MEIKGWSVFKLDWVSVGGRTEAHTSGRSPTSSWRSRQAECKAHSRIQPSEDALLNGLVGPRCTAVVIIEGTRCDCLLDSGSQVTTVSKSFHETYLSLQQILPLNNILEIEGAGGQAVPYLGYVEVTILFPDDIAGKSEEVRTLALVVPDCRTNMQGLCSIPKERPSYQEPACVCPSCEHAVQQIQD